MKNRLLLTGEVSMKDQLGKSLEGLKNQTDKLKTSGKGKSKGNKDHLGKFFAADAIINSIDAGLSRPEFDRNIHEIEDMTKSSINAPSLEELAPITAKARKVTNKLGAIPYASTAAKLGLKIADTFTGSLSAEQAKIQDTINTANINRATNNQSTDKFNAF